MTPDEQALHDIVKQLEAAWNESDSNGFAAPFADDATFIHIFGGQLDGRRVIEAGHRHIFDTIYKGSHVDFLVRSIRFFRADVAVVFTQGHLRFSEAGEPRSMDARPTLIVVKQQGQWQIVAFQNTKISEVPPDALAASRLAT
jgi:uncharacterized protein (TIGR02246 family)